MLSLVQAVVMSHLANIRTGRLVKVGGGTKMGREASLLWMLTWGWSWYLGQPGGEEEGGKEKGISIDPGTIHRQLSTPEEDNRAPLLLPSTHPYRLLTPCQGLCPGDTSCQH